MSGWTTYASASRCRRSQGGEAQRLKLAGHLAAAALAPARRRAARRQRRQLRGKLLIFDEPTTGLHFEDIARLVRAFGLLLKAGHSLLVIEHNLDVIRAADWIIDLGPEGGERGGELIARGTPAGADAQAAGSRTPAARSLRTTRRVARSRRRGRRAIAAQPRRYARAGHGQHRRARRARAQPQEHRRRDSARPLQVITGVSGSGKSTLAFDILFNEGQRRYLESLNAYARQFVQPAARPDMDAIHGIPPTVAIEQRASRGGLKSTVATLTEIYHFLRLFYVRLGTQYCPDCEVAIAPQSAESIVATTAAGLSRSDASSCWRR